MAQENMAVTRETFDQVILPVYAPAQFVPVREKEAGSGINRIKNMSTFPAVLQ